MNYKSVSLISKMCKIMGNILKKLIINQKEKCFELVYSMDSKKDDQHLITLLEVYDILGEIFKEKHSLADWLYLEL